MTKKAVYAGTFDPFTLGHLNIVERAACLFDEVIIGVATSERKSPLFSLEERLCMTKEALAHVNNSIVLELTGLTVDFAKQQEACYLVRGIRSVADYAYEASVAAMNRQLSSEGIETIFLPTQIELSSLSSSVVRELILVNAFDALAKFLPNTVLKYIIKKPT